ncbi:unnamed protein product [Closterium sp. Yama58-4]|nr:unnamed protein product [Closterium sp. Yama58-4]
MWEEGLAVYRRFYSEEKEHRAGVLALRLEPCRSADVDGCQAEVARSQADVARCQADVKSQLQSEVASLIQRILIAMGPRGMSRLVGMRVTEGSMLTAFPPFRAALIASFQRPVKGGVKARKEKKQRQREQRQRVQRHDEREKQGEQSGQGKVAQEQQEEEQERQGQQEQEEQEKQEKRQQEQQEQLSRFSACAVCCSCQGNTEMWCETVRFNRSWVYEVGARALSKHWHRGRDNFWGDASGPDARKNQHALHCLTSLLDGATWMNVHALPHDLPVFEVRGSEGYGARWSADGLQFRGFLEPQMPDGHAKRWRH